MEFDENKEIEKAKEEAKKKFICLENQPMKLVAVEKRPPTEQALQKAKDLKRKAHDKVVYVWQPVTKDLVVIEGEEEKVTAVNAGKDEHIALIEKVCGLIGNPDASGKDAIGMIFACRMKKLSNTPESQEKIVPVKVLTRK
jgi:hypothetical protein